MKKNTWMAFALFGLAVVAAYSLGHFGGAPGVLEGIMTASGGVAMSVEQLLEKVNQSLEKVKTEVKQTADKALEEATKAGSLSSEVKAAADRGLAELNQLLQASTALTKKVEEGDARMRDLEQRLEQRNRGTKEAPKSLGEIIVSDEAVKQFIGKGAKGSVTVKVNNAITSATTSAGDLIWSQRDPEVVGLPRRRLSIRQLLGQGRTTSNLIEYAKMVTRTNNADMVTEGGMKPESNYVWDRDDAPVRTIAHWVPVSRQAMDDIPQLQTEIDGELRYGLDLKEEQELLRGSGAGQHLHGLIPQATAYSAAFVVAGEQHIDILRLALLQASLAEYPADGIVLHPTDWARIELLKDGENRYLWAAPRNGMGQPALWGLPVIDTQAMNVDEFLVGAFRTAATIYDRMDTEVLISSEDRDNFVKNMLTVRAEKRLALAVKRPAALVTGDFGVVT